MARYRLAVAGVLFVLAANTIAFSDSGYPLLSTAFAAVAALSVLGAAAVMAPLSFYDWGRAAAFAIGATYFLDVMFVPTGRIAALALMVLAFCLTRFICGPKGPRAVSFATTAIAVCTFLALPQQLYQRATLAPEAITLAGGASEGGRPFVHIVLDEMGSLALMPEGAYYDSLRERMVEDYRKRGFDVFDDTHATAGATHISLGEVFGDGKTQTTNYSLADGTFTYEVDQNLEGQRLVAAGYTINDLQNSYLKTCESAAWNCMTYARAGDGASLLRSAPPDEDFEYAAYGLHSTLAGNITVRSSIYYQALARVAGWFVDGRSLASLFVARPPLVIETMDRAIPAMRDLQPGQAVVMHLLLPHFPYVLDAKCRLLPLDRARAPRWVLRGSTIPFDRAATERAYWEQAACAHTRLMALVDAIISSPRGKDAVILVHGDHGSRLLEKVADPEHDDATPEERRLALLAHFAVRGANAVQAELAADNRLPERVASVVDYVVGARPSDDRLVTSALPPQPAE